MRSGNTRSANNFIGFLEDTLARFGEKRVGFMRFDSGFCQKDIFDYLEQKPLDYVVAAKFAHPIQHLVDQQDTWLNVVEGISIRDKTYQAAGWEVPIRIVIVRQKIEI